MISFIQKNLYTYFAIYIVNIIEYRLVLLIYIESVILHDSSPYYEIEDGDFSWIKVKRNALKENSLV